LILKFPVALTEAGENRAGALEHAMISLEDCIAFSGLNKDEVDAISEHEHIPEIAAAALANYLLKQPDGGKAIRTMIIDDIDCTARCRLLGVRRTWLPNRKMSAYDPKRTSRGAAPVP
jgi:hypothetical protein